MRILSLRQFHPFLFILGVFHQLGWSAQLAVTDGSTQSVSFMSYSATAGSPTNAAIYAANLGSTINGIDLSAESSFSGVPAIFSTNGGTINLSVTNLFPSSVTVTATSAIGILASSAGKVSNLSSSFFSVTGDMSVGFLADGRGSSVVSNSLTVVTGDGAYLALAQNGGSVQISNSTQSLTGDTSVLALSTGSGSRIELDGVSGSVAGDASRILVAQDGGNIEASSSSFFLNGTSDALVTVTGKGSTAQITGSVISTGIGSIARGAVVEDGGLLQMSGSNLSSEGDDQEGIRVTGGGSRLTSDGSSISSGGTDAPGVQVTDAARATLDTSSVFTRGTRSPGVQVTDGARATLNASSVSTQGPQSPGLLISGAGSRLVSRGSDVTSSALDSPAIQVKQQGQAALEETSIFTSSRGSGGLIASGGSAVKIEASDIYTGKQDSYGLQVTGPGSEVRANSLFVQTDASSGVVVTNGGRVVIRGISSVSTAGRSSNGLWAQGTGGAEIVVKKGSEIATTGKFSSAVLANGSSRITLEGGRISTTGRNAIGLEASGKGSLVTAAGTFVISQGKAGGTVRATNGGTVFIGSGSQLSSTGPRAAALQIHNGGISAQGATVQSAYTGVSMLFGGQLNLTDTTVSSAGDGVFIAGTTSADPNIVTMRGGSILADKGDAFHFLRPVANVSVSGGTIISNRGDAFHVSNGYVYYVFDDSQPPPEIPHSVVNILVNEGTVVTAENGNLLNVESPGTVTFTADDVELTGDIRVASASDTTVTLQNGTILTGRVDPPKMVIDQTSRWNVTGSSELVSLALRGTVAFQPPAGGNFKSLSIQKGLSGGGNFYLNSNLREGKSDQIFIGGRSSGDHRVFVTNEGGTPQATDAVRLITAPAGGANFRLANPGGRIEAGMLAFKLQEDSGNWSLTTQSNGGDFPELSAVGKAVIDTAASQSLLWQEGFEPLNSRMGDLRASVVEVAFSPESPASVDGKSAVKKELLPAAPVAGGDVWVRGHGGRTNASTGLTGDGFQQYVYGVEMGFDKAFRLDKSWLFTGFYGGWSGASRSFDDSVGSGLTESVHGGLYATWLTDGGWYLDGVSRLGYLDNQFDATTALGSVDHGQYGNWAFGFSLEGGKRFALGNGWFVEPQLQVAYTHLSAADYATREDVTVGLAATDVFLGRAGLQIGNSFRTSLGTIQPYLKVAFLQTLSTGGNVTSGGYDQRPNFDGPSVEAGSGVAMQVTERAQLYGEYGFAAAERYTQPWSVSGGFRWTW